MSDSSSGRDSDTKEGNGVSLDELINQDAPGPTPPGGSDLDLQKVDTLLFAQDPKLRETISEIKKPEIKGEIELDFFDEAAINALDSKKGKLVTPEPKEKVKKLSLKEKVAANRKKIQDSAKKLAPTPKNVSKAASENMERVKSINFKAVLATVLGGIRGFFASLGGTLKGAKSSSKLAKIAFVGVMMLFMMLGFVVQLTMTGRLIPTMDSEFVPTVAIDADAAWMIEGHEREDDFFSSLRHPEHIVLLERLVVNIRPSESSGPNPMGYFDFYVEASTEEAAVEINDRMAEVRDKMQRTLEEITYDDLITIEGKNKLKLIMRKNLNPILSRGRVRKIYFKSIVIKP